MRAYCRRNGRPFTTSYTTRFPEYISARSPIPESWIYRVLRWFHAGATVTMVATPSLMSELSQRGFAHLGMWTRGVDIDLFRPDRAIDLGFERPIFMTVGRVAVEKNLEAFLSLDLPGTKAVIGAGPQLAKLNVNFLTPNFSARWRMALSPRIWRPPTFLFFPAAPIRSASFNSRRWRAAFRSPPFRLPVRKTSSAISRSAFWTRTSAAPAWRHCSFLATPAANSRSVVLGKTARGNLSVTSARRRAATVAKLIPAMTIGETAAG